MAATTHKRLSASSAHRWMECPGSIRLSTDIPDEGSVYAAEGSAAHFLAETCLRKNRAADAYLGRIILPVQGGFSILKADAFTPEGDHWTVTDEMADAVQVYLDVIALDRLENPHLQLAIEKTFDLSELHPDLGGTNDAVLSAPFDRVICYDYKHGAGYAVDVFNNPQLLYYALGAYMGSDCSDVEIVIVQPRAIHRDGPVRRQRLSTQELLFWANESLMPAVRRASDPGASLNAGTWCRFCKAKAICPALRSTALEVVGEDFTTVELPPTEKLSDRDIVRVLQGRELLDTWLNSLEEYVKDRLRTGGTLPGFKLVRGRSNRRWTSEDTLVERFFKHRKKLFTHKLISPSQFSKLYKKEGWQIKYEDLVTTPEGALTLAPESDPRPAVVPGQQFESLEDDF